MADEFKYTLTFESVSVGSGAKQAADGLEQVEQKVRRLTSSQADLRAEFGAVSERFDAARAATYNLDEALAKGAGSSGKFVEAQNRIPASARNNAQALLELSRGFEDLQYGIRGVLNNIPSLVMSLGGGAGLAGAISIGAVAGSILVNTLSQTEAAADAAAEKLEGLAERVGSLKSEQIAKLSDNITASADAARKLAENYDQTQAAEQAFATGALDRAEKLAQAQRLIAESLGIQVDAYKELEAAAAREQERRRLAAEQAVAAENDKVAKAREALEIQADEVRQLAELNAQKQAELAAARELLQTLRATAAETERISKQSTSVGTAITPAGPVTARDPELVRQRDEAAANLEGLKARIGAQEAIVADLAGAAGRIGRDNTGTLAKATVELNALGIQLRDVSQAAATNIENIRANLQADDLLARSQTVSQQAETLAAQINEALGKVQTSTSAGQAARESLLGAVEDGRITAEETAGVAESLRTLIGLLQTGQATIAGNVGELINLQKTNAAIMAGQKAQIVDLWETIRNLQQIPR